MAEETGVQVDPEELLQLGVWDLPGRDPRGRYVTVTYVVVPGETTAVAGLRRGDGPAVAGGGDPAGDAAAGCVLVP
ncbi:hypothetical protein ACIQV3_39830 [Streptomyces sp. NPDC099050]|uniref:hypothetical protein n=1 Tax=Streptomyces sp. NPDC099050 TaxID=3366100 RepID=UPI0038198D44